MSPTVALAYAIQQPVAIVYYDDAKARDELVEDIALLADEPVIGVRTLDDLPPDGVVLVLPADDASVVTAMDGCTGVLLARASGSVILFLPRDFGPLPPDLESLTRSARVDPDLLAQVDAPSARAEFEIRTGMTPEAWLSRYAEHDSDLVSIETQANTFEALFLRRDDE